MAKEIPYFRFYPGEWIAKNITMLPMSAQGVFINVCCYYWVNDCDLSERIVNERFNGRSNDVQTLVENDIIKITENGKIEISFLDEQYEQLITQAGKRTNAARIAGLASAKKRSTNRITKRQRIVNESSTIANDKDIYNIIYIVEYLNKKTGKSYKHQTPKTRQFIRTRFKEGYTNDDFVKVIDNQCAQWKGKEEWDKYLRPETLFGNKFESYLNNKPIEEKRKVAL